MDTQPRAFEHNFEFSFTNKLELTDEFLDALCLCCDSDCTVSQSDGIITISFTRQGFDRKAVMKEAQKQVTKAIGMVTLRPPV